ncbi:hypothetical protein NL676_036870 [Syzygium grande]|nr:hypothetical protein NL676_036870 [Syzygium grande]
MGMRYHESRVLKCLEDHLFLAIKSQAHQAHLAPGSSVWYLFKCYRMASSTSSASFSMAVLTSACVWVLIGASASAQLSFDYYTRSCPVLFPTLRLTVGAAIAKEAQMGASLLRLFFHDCFVNSCDGSILLDDTPTFTGEKNAAPNVHSVQGFEVVDQVKSAVEGVCPGIISWADLLAIIARDSVMIVNCLNSTSMKPGRRDARSASQAAANESIPPPTSDLKKLISSFQNVGLNIRDLVAFAGNFSVINLA